MRTALPASHVRTPPRRLHFFVVALAWTVFAVYGSLVPLRYHSVDFADALEQFRNLPPLWVGMGTRADWVANILLFIPLTCFWMGALVVDRGRVATWASAVVLAPLAIAAAVALEFTQIWFMGRTVSRNDILAESIGGTVGIVAWIVAGPRVVGWIRSFGRARQPRSALRWLLEAYLAGFVIYSVIPLDLTISLTDLYGKFRRGNVLIVPFSYAYESPATVVYQFFSDVATFVPVGALLALLRLPRNAGRSAFLSGAIAGGGIALVLEFAQLLVLSRFTDVTDIFLGALGAGIGSWWMVRADRRLMSEVPASGAWSPKRATIRWGAILLGYSLLLVVGFLYPFNWTDNRALILERYEGFFRVPFQALYEGSEFNAIKQFLIRFLMFAVLGIVLGRLSQLPQSAVARAAATLLGVGYAAALALAIEGAQVFMPARVADSTEVVICTAGAIAGVFMARRVLETWKPTTAGRIASASRSRTSGR